MGKNDGHVAGIREPAVAFIDWLLDSYGQDVAIVLVAVDAQPIYDQIFSDRSATAENLFLYKGFNTGDDVPVSGQVLGHPSYSQHQAMATKLESYLRSDVLPEITF